MSVSWQSLSFAEAEQLNLSLISVAIAILPQEDKFLMQLRDNIPGIIHPDCWGLFGGHLEIDESPETALRRELKEEINYQAKFPQPFRCYRCERIIRYVFHESLTVSLSDLSLNEGWDFGFLTIEEIRRGYGYSTKAQTEKKLGDVHQQILLDFIATQHDTSH